MATGIQTGVFTPLAVSQKELAGRFKPENNVGAANTSTFVTNAAQNILPLNVRYHTLVSREYQLKVRVLGSLPVTPVKVDRLEQLLTGYSPALKTFLLPVFHYYFIFSPLDFHSSFTKMEPSAHCGLRIPCFLGVVLYQCVTWWESFISPLIINRSALESTFSVLKHTSVGNLSPLNYGPSLGRFNYHEGQVVVNQNSETSYWDITSNLDGGIFVSSGYLITVQGNRIRNDMCQFKFPVEISQSTIGGGKTVMLALW